MEGKDLLEQTEIHQGKKTWVTPAILDSPVIAVTESGGSSNNHDSELEYS